MKKQEPRLVQRAVWNITKLSVLLIYQTPRLTTAVEECGNEERSGRGIALLNHTYKSLYTEDYPSCLTSCMNDFQCMSLNYWWHTSQCDLNNRTRYSAEAKVLKRNVLSTYIGLMREPLGPCKFDFEDGIDGWEKTGTAFNNQPTYGDNPTARNRGQPANQQGDWWIGGFEDRSSKTAAAGKTQGDSPQGTLTSPYFNIRGQHISFLIGGGNAINFVRVELVINGQVVKTETGNRKETMTRKFWDVTAFIGQRARVRLVDSSSGGWGHINFDDLKGDISCDRSLN